MNERRRLTAAEVEGLMDAHGRAVLTLAVSYLGDRGLAEDVFQEVFVRAYGSAAGLRDPRRVRTWLLSVTANLCRDQLKSWARRNLVFTAVLPELPDDGAGDGDVAELPDRRLAEAVLELPLPLREVVFLHYYEGLDARDAAAVLGIPTVTVRTRLHRARRRLERALTEEVLADA